MTNLRLFQIKKLLKLITKGNGRNFYLYLKKGDIKDFVFDGYFYQIIENGCD